MAKKKSVSEDRPITQALIESIDELGRVRAQRLALEKREKELDKILKDGIPNGKTVYGQQFGAAITVPTKTIVDVPAVRKSLGDKKFMEIASVTLTALKTKMTPEQIEGVTMVESGSPRINIFPAVPGLTGTVEDTVLPEDVVRATI